MIAECGFRIADWCNERRRDEATYEALCASDHSSGRVSAAIQNRRRNRQTTVTLRHVRWRKLQGECRAKSPADFIAKMGIVEEEADESIYWIELLIESGLVKRSLVDELLDEANQIVAIVVSSIRTARGNNK
ncbi:MAG TPA: four helix bundle protein [Pyrinomonadaceae bacterium]|nr:four helix bundle protein [Pyrinomonadaceae bacterium]